MDACTNPDILKVIYFFNIILDIVKVIIPIALIVLGIIDFSKSVINSDEKEQKKSLNLFLKRLLYGVLIFTVPWIIEVLMITLGDLIDEDNMGNFTDCLENAKSECIESLESYDIEKSLQNCDITKKCYYCSSQNQYYWGYFSPISEGNKCSGSADGDWYIDKTKTEGECQ